MTDLRGGGGGGALGGGATGGMLTTVVRALRVKYDVDVGRYWTQDHWYTGVTGTLEEEVRGER